jgi:hypothetical protein
VAVDEMQLPFTKEQFLDLFEAYNEALWPAIVLLWVASTIVISVNGGLGCIPLGRAGRLRSARGWCRTRNLHVAETARRDRQRLAIEGVANRNRRAHPHR